MCLSLIEEVQSKVDQSEAEEQLKKLQKNEFTLDDFRSQLRQVKKLGSFSKIMKLLPDQLLGGMGMPQIGRRAVEADGEGAEAHRGDHRLDDARRADRSQDPERQPAPPHCARFGNDGRGGEQAHQAVHRDAADDAAAISSGMFGGSGLKGKMMRRMAGMPELERAGGDNGDEPACRRWPAGAIAKENEEEAKETQAVRQIVRVQISAQVRS